MGEISDIETKEAHLLLSRSELGNYIDQYHTQTKREREAWRGIREKLERMASKIVPRIVQRLRQEEASDRAPVGNMLECFVQEVRKLAYHRNEARFIDLLGWARFDEMNVYGEDEPSGVRAKVLASVLEEIGQQHTREESAEYLRELYRSGIRPIGPGITGLLYGLRPAFYPVMGHRMIRGFRRIFRATQGKGQVGLRHLADNLPLIWRLSHTFREVLDPFDMGDLSGFLSWAGDRIPLKEPGTLPQPIFVRERPETYCAEPGEWALLLDLWSYLRRSTFQIKLEMLANFYLSLKTKPFVILAGVSGTGKSRLVRLLSEAINGREGDRVEGYGLIPVRPNWSDKRDLLGFENLLTGKYQMGEMLRAMLAAEETPEHPFLVCLDEMNLARVEHYFSDFLSVMETREEREDGSWRTDTIELAQRYGDKSLATSDGK